MYKKYVPSLFSVIFYAFGNNILNEKLKGVNAIFTVVIYSGIMFLVSMLVLFVFVVALRGTRFEVLLPGKGDIWISAMQVGFSYVIADLLYTFGYTIGVSLMFATSCYGMIPVAALIIRLIRTGEIPNIPYMLGCMCVAGGIILIAYGDKISEAARTTVMTTP